MPLLRENELARRSSAGLDLRPDSLRLRWEFSDLPSSDGHELTIRFTASARALPDRTERQMLEELLLDGKTAVTVDDVVRHFFTSLRAAALRSAESIPARDAVEEDAARQKFIATLKSAAEKTAFACGIDITGPFELDVQSPTLERQRLREMRQAMAEREAAGQVEHLHRTAELLKQFEALRQAAPSLSAGNVLEQINPADRGSLMAALFHASAGKSTTTLWAVAGPTLVRIETAEPLDGRAPPSPRLIPLPTALGPLRSVSVEPIDDRLTILVGAQKGIMVVDADDPTRVRSYVDGGATSLLGFNRVVWLAGRRQICATHSEAGLVCWDIDSPGAPALAMRPAELGAPALLPSDLAPDSGSRSISMRGAGAISGPRNAQAWDRQSLAFSVGGRVILWDGQKLHTICDRSPSEAAAIMGDGRRMVVTYEDGTVAEIDRATRRVARVGPRVGRVRAVGALPWLGEQRLLAGGDEGPIQCLGLDDGQITQYFSQHRGLRIIGASAAVVAATTSDRQRIVAWNAWEGRQPALEWCIGALARHRIADMVLHGG